MSHLQGLLNLRLRMNSHLKASLVKTKRRRKNPLRLSLFLPLPKPESANPAKVKEPQSIHPRNPEQLLLLMMTTLLQLVPGHPSGWQLILSKTPRVCALLPLHVVYSMSHIHLFVHVYSQVEVFQKRSGIRTRVEIPFRLWGCGERMVGQT